jgi:TPP-dependent pyruvate/acetoin dehydrogenase alpha subunit
LYRPPGELDAWKARDPIDIFGARLGDEGAASQNELTSIRADVEAEISATAERVLAMPKATADDMFRNIYAESSAGGGS